VAFDEGGVGHSKPLATPTSNHQAARVKAKAPRFLWLHFTLRSLLVIVTVCCVLLGILVKQARERKAAVMAVKQLGGTYGFHLEPRPVLSKLLKEPSGIASYQHQ
jgi:hypothetical protein